MAHGVALAMKIRDTCHHLSALIKGLQRTNILGILLSESSQAANHTAVQARLREKLPCKGGDGGSRGRGIPPPPHPSAGGGSLQQVTPGP